MNRKIIGIGETVLDVIFREDQPIAAVPGGSTFNALVSLGRSIGKEMPDMMIQMVTETGDDHIGDIVVEFMQRNKISTEYVTRNKDTQTHVSMAFLDKNNDAQYEFFKNHANTCLDTARLREIEFKVNDVLLFGSFFAINPVIRAYTASAFRSAQAAGAILYYDINFRKSHIKDIPQTIDYMLENISLSTVVRGSADDFLYLFGTSNPQEIYDRHIKSLCPLFICTAGSEPITVLSPNHTERYSVEQIKTVSTIGAGDNFNAGFIYGILKNGLSKEDLDQADKIIWDKLIASGQSFSSRVCQSIFNYIDQ